MLNIGLEKFNRLRLGPRCDLRLRVTRFILDDTTPISDGFQVNLIGPVLALDHLIFAPYSAQRLNVGDAHRIWFMLPSQAGNQIPINPKLEGLRHDCFNIENHIQPVLIVFDDVITDRRESGNRDSQNDLVKILSLLQNDWRGIQWVAGILKIDTLRL